MISLLLLLVLAWGFYIGYRRGLLLQVYYLISAMASAFMAGQFYKGLENNSIYCSLMQIRRKVRELSSSHRINSFSWIRSFTQVLATCLYLGLSIASVVCLVSCYTYFLVKTGWQVVPSFSRYLVYVGDLICLANGLDHLGDHSHGSYTKSS